MNHWRNDLAGLAHFLEHMLFTGTAKYPKEGVVFQRKGGDKLVPDAVGMRVRSRVSRQ